MTALAVLAAIPLAAPARATTVAVSDGVLHVEGGPDQDLVQLLVVGDALRVDDQYRTVTAGPGCVPSDAGPALCSRSAITSIDVRLGAGNDMLIAQSDVPVSAYGEEGDDALTTLAISGGRTQPPVVLDGGPGDDQLGGGAGDDTLDGGPGDDGLDGHGGADVVEAGPGRDAVADSGGDDTIQARDGEPDYVDCGPGTDTGDFDPFDHAVDCELGQLPPPDCRPHVDGPTAVRLARLRRTATISLSAAAPAGCSLRARLTDARGALLGVARAAAGRSLRITLSRSAVRRLRHGARLSLVVEGRAAGAAVRQDRHVIITVV